MGAVLAIVMVRVNAAADPLLQEWFSMRNPITSYFDAAARTFLATDDADFLTPAGEEALVGPHSVSWCIFKNPVTLFIGGVAGEYDPSH